jgi:hypothetical protein
MRAAALVALAGLSFLLVAAALRERVPLPPDQGMRTKFEVWQESADDYDILFLGSSRTLRGVRPDLVDARLTTTEHRIRSFNFGVPGMFSFEADALLDRVLEHAPERTRIIVMEVPQWTPTALGQGPDSTLRGVRWHSPSQTLKVLESLRLSEDRSLVDRVTLAGIHLRSFGYWLSNVGMGAELGLFGAATSRPFVAGPERDEIVRSQGYSALETENARRFAYKRRKFDDNAATYRLRMARRRDRGPLDPSLRLQHRYNYDAIRDQVERVEATGRRIVYLSLPQTRDRPMGRLLLTRGVIPDLIDLNRPDLYPGVFSVESHYDADHLSIEGAERLAPILAEQLARRLGDARQDGSP